MKAQKHKSFKEVETTTKTLVETEIVRVTLTLEEAEKLAFFIGRTSTTKRKAFFSSLGEEYSDKLDSVIRAFYTSLYDLGIDNHD